MSYCSRYGTPCFLLLVLVVAVAKFYFYFLFQNNYILIIIIKAIVHTRMEATRKEVKIQKASNMLVTLLYTCGSTMDKS